MRTGHDHFWLNKQFTLQMRNELHLRSVTKRISYVYFIFCFVLFERCSLWCENSKTLIENKRHYRYWRRNNSLFDSVLIVIVCLIYLFYSDGLPLCMYIFDARNIQRIRFWCNQKKCLDASTFLPLSFK